jgi:hypothetical protein
MWGRLRFGEYYDSKGGWYTNVNCKRVLLARGPKRVTKKED